MTVRIAVVQQETRPGKVDENRAKALDFAHEALDHDVDPSDVLDARNRNPWFRGQRRDLHC